MSINKLILKQLEKVQDAQISEYDVIKHCYYISKKKDIKYEVNHQYLIQLNRVVMSKDTVWASNWNAGRYPTHEFMKIDVSKRLGDMIYVTGLYYNNETNEDINEMWEGWICTTEIHLVKEL